MITSCYFYISKSKNISYQLLSESKRAAAFLNSSSYRCGLATEKIGCSREYDAYNQEKLLFFKNGSIREIKGMIYVPIFQ